MILADVQEVVIDPCGGFKYIAVKLVDGSGFEKLVVRANEECINHMDILSLLWEEINPSDSRPCWVGGGQIWVSPKEKIIHIWGRSGDFGQEPDRQQTVSLLQKTFPDFQIISC